MSPPVDDRYFEWLYSHFNSVRNRNPARSYWKLARQLYKTEFVWLVPNDDNRVEDGKILRQDFMHEQGSDGITDEWLHLGCSVLEMLIALSMRAEFQDDGKTSAEWFQLFLKNLGLLRYTDDKYDVVAKNRISQILENFIYRNYRPNGRGGLFPLRKPPTDQSKVELWYQLSAYLLEHE